MIYAITSKGDCQFRFNHYISGKYVSEIRLELAMHRVTTGEKETSLNTVKETIITFLDTIPENAVTVENQKKVSIHMPITCFDSFNKMLCESLNDNKYKIKLETIGEGKMTFAKFHFIPQL